MSVHKELMPNHYVGDFVSITIHCRQKDSTHPKIMMLETDIDQVLRKIFLSESEQSFERVIK